MSIFNDLSTQEINLAADEFVKIAQIDHNWPSLTDLNNLQRPILAELLVKAGFELSGFEPRMDRSDVDGTYPSQTISSIVVLDKEGHINVRATGWLYCAMAQVIEDLSTIGYDEAVKKLEKEIRRSVPLEAIRIDKENGYLLEFPPKIVNSGKRFGYFVDHTRDEHSLPYRAVVGIHDYHCQGEVVSRPCSGTHFVLHCLACHWRITVPVNILTYGDLRNFFER